MREIIDKVLFTIKAFIHQPIILTKSMDFVKKHNGSFSGADENNTYAYYWINDYKTGYEVKVKLTYDMGYDAGFNAGLHARKELF